MSIPQKPPETQPGTLPGLGAPVPTPTPSTPPGASQTSTRGPVPIAFRLPCPGCGAIVLVPYDPAKGALMDWLLFLEEHLEDLPCIGVAVVHEIIAALHAVRERLEVCQ